MKKNILFILIFIILILTKVYATQGVITDVDFSLKPQQAFILGDADGISFMINDKEYVISVDDIGRGSVRIKSFNYNDNGERETFYIPLNGKLSYKLDLDKDDIYDIKVDLFKIEDDGRAVIVFERISESKNKDQVTSETTSNINFIDNNGMIIIGLIVIAGVIAYFTFRKK